jgi:hypothetical protein
VTDRDRDADARRRHVEIGDAEDLPRLVHGLDLLPGGAALGESVDLRQDVEGHRLAEDVADGKSIEIRPAEVLHLVVELLDLLGELSRPVTPGSRNRLVRRQHQRANAGCPMQGCERHHRHDRRAVGDGDDLRRSVERLRVHLRHHERHVRFHAERGGLVDAHRSTGGGLTHEAACDRCPGGGEGEVHAPESFDRELPDGDLAAVERDRPAG